MKYFSLCSLLIVACISSAFTHAASCQNRSFPFGKKIGEYNGVSAYSNCNYNYFSNDPTYSGDYKTGYKWQCVEFAARYFKEKFNRKIAGGNANAFCNNAAQKGLNKSDNGQTTDKPQPGNLICSNGGPYGHCAIVREVGNDYIRVIEQNFNNSSSDANHKLTLKKDSKGRYTVGGFSREYPVACWMWPIAQSSGPDFVVSSLWLKEGTTVRSGTRVHPYCTVKNVGASPSPSGIRLAYYIDADKYRDDDGIDATKLCAGCSQTENVSNDKIKLGDKGTRSYRCCVDYKEQVSETSESNNCSTMSFTVK